MTTWTFRIPVLTRSSLQHLSGGQATSGPGASHDLGMSALAIAVLGIAIGLIAVWHRGRQRAAARAHIRSIRVVRRRRDGVLEFHRIALQSNSPNRPLNGCTAIGNSRSGRAGRNRNLAGAELSMRADSQ
jgi:hypothetical protein